MRLWISLYIFIWMMCEEKEMLVEVCVRCRQEPAGNYLSLIPREDIKDVYLS